MSEKIPFKHAGWYGVALGWFGSAVLVVLALTLTCVIYGTITGIVTGAVAWLLGADDPRGFAVGCAWIAAGLAVPVFVARLWIQLRESKS